MALIKTAPIVSDLRGSIGGVTFTRTRHGLVARRRIKPTLGQSNSQTRARAAYSQAVLFWRDGLSEQNRLDWNTAGRSLTLRNKLGDPLQPSGFQLFLRSALSAAIISRALPTAPPVPLLEPFPSYVLSWNEGADTVDLNSLTNQPPLTSGALIWWSSPDLSPSVYSPRGPWTFIDAEVYTAGIAIDLSFGPFTYRMRPCRRFYRIRAHSFPGGVSSLVTIPILIPAEP